MMAKEDGRLVDLLTERETTHGSFALVARVAQAVKDAVASVGQSDNFTPVQQEAIDMIASKLGRIAAGNPMTLDHWEDIAGYAELAAREIRSLKMEFRG